jgi:hypothetical protein
MAQANLLVADNQTRAWDALTWPERRILYEGTWGLSELRARRLAILARKFRPAHVDESLL